MGILASHLLSLLTELTVIQSSRPFSFCGHQKPFPHPSSPQRPHTLPSRMQIPLGTPLLHSLSNCSADHSWSTFFAHSLSWGMCLVSCRHPWDTYLPAPIQLALGENPESTGCAEHCTVPHRPFCGHPFSLASGEVEIIMREAAMQSGDVPRGWATSAPPFRHKLKLTAKTAIKPQVCLELFSVLLDAPGFNYGLKSPNTSARICLPSPRGGARTAMVAPLLWQSH